MLVSRGLTEGYPQWSFVYATGTIILHKMSVTDIKFVPLGVSCINYTPTPSITHGSTVNVKRQN